LPTPPDGRQPSGDSTPTGGGTIERTTLINTRQLGRRALFIVV